MMPNNSRTIGSDRIHRANWDEYVEKGEISLFNFGERM